MSQNLNATIDTEYVGVEQPPARADICCMPVFRRARAAQLSEAIQRDLVDRLFTAQETTIAGAIAVAVEAVVGCMQTHQSWFLTWGGVSLLVIVVRIAHESAFRRRRDPAKVARGWLRWYSVGAAVSGLLCGIGAAAAIGWSGNISLMLFGVWVALVYGAAVRNAVFPPAAKLFIGFAQLPSFAVTVAHPDLAHLPYLSFNFMFYGSAVAVMRALYTQTVQFLRVDEEKAELLTLIRNSNVELAAANERLALMATIDGLTEVVNRRGLDEALAVAASASYRDGFDVSLLMLDIDYFKKYNDRYGHPAGDECLRRVARALRANLRRPTDLLARYGGEEFVVLLPHTDEHGVEAVAKLLRSGIEALAITSADSVAGVVTVSIGAATARGGRPWTSEQLVGRADAALYDAKRSGRNRVASAPNCEPAASRVG